jgi:hypothetical protein
LKFEGNRQIEQKLVQECTFEGKQQQKHAIVKQKFMSLPPQGNLLIRYLKITSYVSIHLEALITKIKFHVELSAFE